MDTLFLVECLADARPVRFVLHWLNNDERRECLASERKYTAQARPQTAPGSAGSRNSDAIASDGARRGFREDSHKKICLQKVLHRRARRCIKHARKGPHKCLALLIAACDA